MVIVLGREPGGITHGPAGAGEVVGVALDLVEELIDDTSQGAALMPLSVVVKRRRAGRIAINIFD